MNWIDYWNTDRIFRSIMRRMTCYFFSASRKLLAYKTSDVVLDFGCGPGFFVENLTNRVKEVHGVDTSARMISECTGKFRDCPNAFFHTLESDRYTDLGFLSHRKVTKTVVLSVVQYFHSSVEVLELIRSVASISAPGACLLIADIPTQSVPLLDTMELVRSCWQEGYLLECMRFLAQTRFSRYSRVRTDRGLLCLPITVLEQLIAELDLDAEILTDPLTYNHRRVHLMVQL
jgi:SAM-dependent methyltransferase